ncbi:hypothetical protein QTJ16_000283 [Diplocarpon rosae]|uniref:CBM1 domain-containing protein n=1 Tax=Diplocarpon rosae TaxID=946125 RepID=A0AAD9WGN2_9HELO|nr:hypothetical protein QTJ16_000283 [Diplocarpon rosae]
MKTSRFICGFGITALCGLTTVLAQDPVAARAEPDTGTATSTVPSFRSFTAVPVPDTVTYDYIVIGGGAGGIPMADKLSATGKSVLLIEKGVGSSSRWGGTYRPESGWLDGSNLTWIDVPGLCNRIWTNETADIKCSDTDQVAGCILGGGTAVNAGLWLKPPPLDWDLNFPEGWKSSDLAAATERVFSRIPGTDVPSMDGARYIQSGFDTLRGGLDAAGWGSVAANDVPAEKNRTYAHTTYMFSNGERGGPLATYLVDANDRPNFDMWLNTSVERIDRDGGHATSLYVTASNDGGRIGTVRLTPITGRVILAGGVFGTSKLLFRSGIGPTDQLEVVLNSSEGASMINSSYWLNLPVGHNLDDHLNTDTVISHPNVSYYDWVAAWNTPIEADKTAYLTKRSGPLAQSAPNIGPFMWEEIVGPDGINRHFQWTSRVEGSSGVANGNSMTLSLYLGRGKAARGRVTIGKDLKMVVSELPYDNTADIATAATAIDHMVEALSSLSGLTWIYPAPGQSGADYLTTVPLTLENIGARRSNHWMGTAKLGTDSGLLGGTSVVDTNTKVYGTDNIFVADASIFPGIVTTNPAASIVIAAEHASEKILALPENQAVPKNAQCGGLEWTGGMACANGTTCVYKDASLSQCL